MAFGIKHLQNNCLVDGVLVLLADQPLIDSAHLSLIISTFKNNQQHIVASTYKNGKLGVPVLFDAHYFEVLSKITDDKGAKQIIEENKAPVSAIKADHLLADIDTEEDYKQLYESNHQ